MKTRQYTEEQIIAVLREAEAGAKITALCRKYGMSDATYYNQKTKYAGLSISELKRLKALKDENQCLKQIVAEQALDNRALKSRQNRDQKTSKAQGQAFSSLPCQGQPWAK